MPRTEFVNPTEDNDKNLNIEVLDLTALGSNDDFGEIDTGVTSGADSSDWDPINIDEDKAEEECAGAGSASAATKGSPAACGVKQKQ